MIGFLIKLSIAIALFVGFFLVGESVGEEEPRKTIARKRILVHLITKEIEEKEELKKL